ncbi:hypothetical protein PoB_007073500 [Plakobranchus ocellatus]|uniref:Uncharacterized protein n=1 Tax=Plakobranchus ocellatus TaxID=259542 RepID=A0AAV4DJB7_9GAST|nr:hypothetical protein PoB_007073500 [Plakobranchus ocellatus]
MLKDNMMLMLASVFDGQRLTLNIDVLMLKKDDDDDDDDGGGGGGGEGRGGGKRTGEGSGEWSMSMIQETYLRMRKKEAVRGDERVVGRWRRGRKETSPVKHIKKTSLDVAHPSNVGHSRAATVVLFVVGPKPYSPENQAENSLRSQH